MVFEVEDLVKNFLLLMLALLVALVAYFQWSFSYWRRKGVVHPSPSIPFGNVRFRTNFSTMKLFADCYKNYKSKGYKYCGVYSFVEPAIVLFDLDLIKTILVRDFQYFTDHGYFANEKKEPLTGNLFTLNGLKWKNMRTKLTPTFTSAKMRMMLHNLVKCTNDLVEVMDQAVESKEAVDIKENMSRFTTDAIYSCAFGVECNSLKNPDSEFRKYGKKAFKHGKLIAFIKYLLFIYPKLLQIFSFKTMEEATAKFFLNVVKKTVDYREKNNIIRKDFMHLLIQLKNNIDIRDKQYTNNIEQKLSGGNDLGESLTIEEIAAQAYVFFVAGFESTSKTITLCLYELATNTIIQERLRKEINDVLTKYQGEITYDAIIEMHYMDKCMEETLRKYPPATTIMRQCTKNYNVPNSDLVVEKGTRLFISVSAIHNDAEYYPEPEKFDPERFSPENKAKRHPFSWFPFSVGPRNCIGMRFAIMEIKIALAVLLARYRFVLNAKTHAPQILNFSALFSCDEGDIWLNVERISG